MAGSSAEQFLRGCDIDPSFWHPILPATSNYLFACVSPLPFIAKTLPYTIHNTLSSQALPPTVLSDQPRDLPSINTSLASAIVILDP